MEAIILHSQATQIPAALITRLNDSFISGIPIKLNEGQKLPTECLTARLIILITQQRNNNKELVHSIRKQNKKCVIAHFGKDGEQYGVDVAIDCEIIPNDIGLNLKKMVCAKEDSCKKHFVSAYNIMLDLDRRVATRGQKIIPLRNKEIALLEFFIINKDKVLSRDLILEFVWDRNADFSSNTIDVHVNRLRKKLQDDNSLIHTVHSIGYRFALE